MYKRSFTSFSVSSQKLKIVRLSADRKRVIKAVTFDIPQGIIEQGKVQREEDFSKMLKDIWKKERIGDRLVGLIVPEFSTFMNTLSIPKLPLKELDEAVRWKAREFLPSSGEDLILDWKIIEESAKGYEILTVAVEKAVLFGYVDAIDKAGLLPLYVETPSLCLERLAETKDDGKLVVYRSRGIAVATVISGKKIVASSVLPIEDNEGLMKNLVQMYSRFGSEGIKSIAVCGNGLTQDFLNDLQKRFSKPVELLTHKVDGMSDSAAQDYIIALSQQTIDPEEPASERSINLLPAQWVTHYKKQVRDIRLWTTTLVGSVVMWSCFLVSLAIYIFLSQQLNLTSRDQSNSSNAELQKVTAQITATNQLVQRVGKIDSTFSSPQVILKSIFDKKTEGIIVTAYDLNLETSKISLRGKASTRENLIAYKKSLESVKEHTKVNVPLGSLLLETNIDFEIQIDYKK